MLPSCSGGCASVCVCVSSVSLWLFVWVSPLRVGACMYQVYLCGSLCFTEFLFVGVGVCLVRGCVHEGYLCGSLRMCTCHTSPSNPVVLPWQRRS